MSEEIVAAAGRMLAEGRTGDAIASVVRASDAGDADAAFLRAIWHLTGHPVARDLPAALALLSRARRAGHAGAGLMEVALIGNGSGTRADWRAAMTVLEEVAAASGADAAHQLDLLRRMDLTDTGFPSEVPTLTKIGTGPNVWYAKALFSPDECLHVAQCAVDMLAPSTVVDPKTDMNVANPVRTSDAAVIGPTRETLVVQALNRRIAAISGTDVRQGEALSVLRYNPGQEFKPHVDSIAGARNQRVATVLVYLNAGYAGGQTVFERSGLVVQAGAGDAILFRNVGADGSPDPATRHAGAPVIRGTKWLATRWIRARPFDVWTGPEAA